MIRPPRPLLYVGLLVGMWMYDACGALPALDAQRAWLEPVGASSSSSFSIRVNCDAPVPVDKPLEFPVALSSRQAINEAVLRVNIIDPSGNVIVQSDTDVLLGPEEHVYTFKWDATTAPTGEYSAIFSILRPPKIEVARRPYVIKKVCWHDIVATYSRGLAGLEQLAGYEMPSSYARMRAAIARMAATRAQGAMAEGDWVVSYRLAQYLCKSDAAVRSLLVFGNEVPELAEPIPTPEPGRLKLEHGMFLSSGRPVFLLGQNLDAQYDTSLAPMSDLGLSLAVYSLSPAQTISGPDAAVAVPPALDGAFAQADAKKVRVMVSLDQHNLPQWALEQWPMLADTGFGKTDISKPEARQLIEKHIRGVVPYLAQKSAMNGLDIFYEPLFKFSGEEIRQQFLTYVKGKYADRYAVNQAWRGLFANLDEIAVGWDQVNPRYQSTPAYQYDWQTFHKSLGTSYMQELVKMVRGLAGDIPIGAAMKGNILEPGESRFGLDRDALLPLFDLNACSSGSSPVDPVYAMAYPGQSLLYTLLHSLAPNKPIVNFNDQIFKQDTCEITCSFDYVHSVMWEAAMTGMSASALGSIDPSASPACLEGYATAALDLNRLAPVVAAFQRAPALVHILWSVPSKIYENGDPYLQTVSYAYEGCSFGGYQLKFITEHEVVETNLDGVSVLVLPETPSVFDETFEAIKRYVARGGVIIRTATPIQFNEYGFTRRDIIGNTRNTILVRMENLPGGYLSAIDAAITDYNVLPEIARTVTNYGYPLEGVKSRYVEMDGQGYLYLLNLRREAIATYIAGGYTGGRDLIHGQDVTFPLTLDSLRPMLVKLNPKPVEPKPTAVRKGRAIPCP